MCTPAPGGRGRGRVRLNVGGRVFQTTATTLAAAGRDTMLGAMLDASWNAAAAGDEADYFIDRDPACFAVLLDLLRTGGLHVPPHIPDAVLCREALYYGLLDRVRAARWDDFDGDRLRLAASVPGRAPGDGTAVRPAPDGGCCVAHGGAVRVYNWMLEERRPVYLDHAPVNDAAYLDASTLLVAARERPGRRDGGVAAFSALTGEMRHRFRVAHDRQVRSFTPGALAFDQECSIFASCKGRLNEYGIGVWDGTTGEQTGFFYEPPGCALGDADKLQWLDGTKTLMAATMFPRADSSFISLLDFRDKNVVWSWCDVGTPASLEDKHAVHAIAMEDGRSICVINQYDDLGFLDLRSSAGGVRWRSRSKLMSRKKVHAEETCYPKLATHAGQLFASTNDAISVFTGPDHALTSTLRGSDGGAICDFSIGGDRLFALHNEKNVFDVWETPPPPII
ncbi:BTB/POZ domain-containing protein At2g24240-like [Aegilops tauschii subsp. strangulata]|uniref:BTB domain-containing protein n=2 Tax=Aegilops tauschii TaxID=37682 RepID=A0A453P2T8_AEGTS|nr:BTB/POZ domain-containing protein At2g24240-like [Aegilops tauschii subsp. strangulata]